MLQKLKRLGSYLIIIVLLPYVITVFMNGQAVPASKTVDTMQVKAERDGKEMDVPLEDYCIGRMAKEIPVSYEKEALRAQAVLVRTTVYTQIKDNGSQTVFNDGYWTNDDMREQWGSGSYRKNYNRLKNAWDDTEGQVLMYEPVTLTGDTALKGSKTFIGRDMKANEAFEFTLTAADDATKTAIQNEKVKIAANGNKAIVAGAKDGATKAFQFGDVTFTEEGTYTFNINETVPQTQAGGMTYDSHTAQVTIVVTRDTENIGKLKVEVTYNNRSASDVTDRAVFANRYDASTEVTGGTKADISAKKTLHGRNLRAGEFQFKLTTRPADGSNGTVLQEKQNGADGSIAFDSISYKTSDTAAGASAVVLDKAVEAGYAVKSTDADGNTVYTLSYRIYEDTENGTNSNGISVVTETYDFTVTVTDHGNGVLTAVTNYPNGQNQFEFVNQYGTEPVPVEITGSKTLAHDTSLTPADITGKFTFTLEALTEGAPMPAQTTAVNDAAGNVDFGRITFTTDLLQDAITTDSGVRTKEFEYKVTESGSAAGVTNDANASIGKIFKLTLTDDGNGNLTVTRNPADGPLFSFTNTYRVAELPSSITDQVKVNKTLEGRTLKEGEFNFELVEEGNVVAKRIMTARVRSIPAAAARWNWYITKNTQPKPKP